MKRNDFLKKGLVTGVGLTIINPMYPRVIPRIYEEQKEASWGWLVNFITSVTINVISEVIIKWLDRRDEEEGHRLTAFSRAEGKKQISQLSSMGFGFEESETMLAHKDREYSDYLFEARRQPESGHLDNRLVYVVNEPGLHMKALRHGLKMVEVGALGCLASDMGEGLPKESYLPLLGKESRMGSQDSLLSYESRDRNYDVTIATTLSANRTKGTASIHLAPRNGSRSIDKQYTFDC